MRTVSQIGAELMQTDTDILNLLDSFKTPTGEARAATAEEQTKLTELETRAATLDTEHKAAVAGEKRVTDLRNATELRLQGNTTNTLPAPSTTNDVKVFAAPKAHLGLRTFVNADGKEDVDSALVVAKFFLGMQSKDISVQQEVRTWLKEKRGFEYRVMSEGNNTAGGFLVPVEMNNYIIKLQEEYGLRSKCQNVSMGTDTKLTPTWTGDLTAYWVGENASLTAADESWGEVELKARKLTMLAKFSNELREDAMISVIDELSDNMARQASIKEDQALINGTGISTYGGITGIIPKINALTTPAGLTTQATGNTWGAIVLADILKMMGTLPSFAGIKPEFYCSRQFYYNVMAPILLAGGGNTGAMIAMMDLAKQQFLGIPVNFTQVMATTTDVATISLLYGDFRMGVQFGDRKQLTITLHDQTEDAVTKDQTWVRGIERVDFNAHSLGDATLAGAIVALKTGA